MKRSPLREERAMVIDPLVGVEHPSPNKEVAMVITSGLYWFHGTGYTQELIYYTDGTSTEGYGPYEAHVVETADNDNSDIGYHNLRAEDL